ncbi:MAG TPA: hypothetical protein VIX84_02765 [Acidimicrobiales bacterium]
MATSTPAGFAPTLLRGMAEFGPFDATSGDLSLQLGVSLWLRMSGSTLEEARHTLLEVRRLVLRICDLDAATEPVPLVGRSPKSDVVTLAAYAGDLLRRAAARAGCEPHAVADRVIAELPHPADAALGA